MKLNHYHILFFLLVTTAFFSCSESDFEDRDPINYSYFPVAVGNEWVYQVDSTLITGDGTIITNTSSQVKETLTELLQDDGDFKKYKIERAYRSVESEPWEVMHIWTTSIDKERAYKTEDNLRFVKMAFPATEGKNWDATVYFDRNRKVAIGLDSVQFYANWDTSITDVEKVGDKEVVRVINIDSEDFFTKQYSVEEYTEGLGLTYSQILDYADNESQADERPWEDKVEEGFVITHTLISSIIN